MYKKIQISNKNERFRAKTQFSHVDELSIYQQNNKQQQSQEQQDIISETISSADIPQRIYKQSQLKSIEQIFRDIQNPVQYQLMSNELIIAQKQNLQNQVKFLNKQVNQLMKRKMSRVSVGLSRKVQRKSNNSRLKCNQWDDAGIQIQVLNNRKLINLLRDQLQFLSNKLGKIQRSDYKEKYDNLIKQAKQNITKMRVLLFEKKRKNVFATKKIVELDKKDIHKVYFDLQQNYVALMKKKQDYSKRVDKLIKQNTNIIDQQAQVQSQELRLKNQAFSIMKTLPNQMQEQHFKMMYETKCRKMQLSLKKRERDEQGFKRKYYGLLKDYQKTVQNSKTLDQKLHKLQNQIDNSNDSLLQSKKKIQNRKQTDIQNIKQQMTRIWRAQSQQKQQSQKKQDEDEQGQGFLLTQLNNRKSTTRITKVNTPNNSQKPILLPQLKTKSHSYHTPIHEKNKTKVKTDVSRQQKQYFIKSRQYIAHKDKSNQNQMQSSYKQTSRNKKQNDQNSTLKDEQYEYEEDFQMESPQIK